MNELKLHDIKPLVDIPDFSLYIFILLIIIALSLIVIISYLIYKKLKNRGKNQRKIYLNLLKELDLSKTKSSAYLMTKYLRILCISDREKKLSEELISLLEPYKYKKEIEAFDDEIKSRYYLLVEAIDV